MISFRGVFRVISCLQAGSKRVISFCKYHSFRVVSRWYSRYFASIVLFIIQDIREIPGLEQVRLGQDRMLQYFGPDAVQKM